MLFADLFGFTPFAERLDAEDVATVQDAYFALVKRLADWITVRAPLPSRVPSPFARLMWEAMMIRNAEVRVPIPRLLEETPLPGTFAVRSSAHVAMRISSTDAAFRR